MTKKKKLSEMKIGYEKREFVIKWNDFRGIYIFFFFGQKAIGWSKYICNLILTVGFNFDENLIVRSFLNHWDQSITVGSSQDFKSCRWIKNLTVG